MCDWTSSSLGQLSLMEISTCSVCKYNIVGVLQSVLSVQLQLLLLQEAVSVVVGFTRYKHASCLCGYAELKSVSQWSFDYVIPPLINTGMSFSFLLAVATISSDLDATTSTWGKSMSLAGSIMPTPCFTVEIVLAR